MDVKSNLRLPDGPYAIKVLIVVVLANFATALERIQNIFLTQWMQEFNKSQTQIVLIPALLCLSLSIGVILWPTVIQPRLGTKRGLQVALIAFVISVFVTTKSYHFGIFLIFTCLTGIAMSWFLPSSGVALNLWFIKYRVITNQTMEMGRAIYVCIMPFIIQFVIKNYGWRYAMMILAFLPLPLLPFIWLFGEKPDAVESVEMQEKGDDKNEDETSEDSQKQKLNSTDSESQNQKPTTEKRELTQKEIIANLPELPQEKKRLLKFLCLGVIFSFLGMASGRTLFVAYADQKYGPKYEDTINGNMTERVLIQEAVMSDPQRAALVSFFNFSSVGIRLIIILLRNVIIKYNVHAGDLWFWGSMGSVASFGLTPILGQQFGPNGLLMAACFQGITIGIYQGQPITVMANIVGVERLQRWMAIYTLLCGLGNFFGPFTMSKVSEMLGSNDYIYYGIIPMYAIVMICAIVLVRHKL